jgi:hypothetical protein
MNDTTNVTLGNGAASFFSRGGDAEENMERVRAVLKARFIHGTCSTNIAPG